MKFICDAMLAHLGRQLRAAGYDTWIEDGTRKENELLEDAIRTDRIKVSHRSLMNYLEWARSAYGSEHRAALFTSIGFDLTLTSIFLPLISNGEIRIYDNDPFIGLRELQDENAVTFLKATPSHLRILKPMSKVKTLVLGGEALMTSMAEAWSCDVFNEYGPTEATIGCVVHKYDHERDRSAHVPIGQPIANTRLSIERGELVIEGDCVAKGYLGRTRFQNRYHSGDLVEKVKRELNYLGRIDRQLKINGIRIETAEIEAAIESHASITEAVVGVNAQRQLVAFYKGDEVSDLKTYLETKLLSSVIPVIIERRQDYPLSANGKISFDFPHAAAPASGNVPEEKLTPLQERIRNLAAEILGQPSTALAVHEPLGLDSLSLVILLDRLDEPKLFERAHEFALEPTIEKIAATMTSLKT